MTLRARLALEDTFASTKKCTICGASALSVVHLTSFPDYVSCAACGAAFVMEEGGERAMYGSIPPEYPETREFALKQWTSFEAIAALAEAERPGDSSTNNSGLKEAVPEPEPAIEAVPEPEPAMAQVAEDEPEPAEGAFEWPAPASEEPDPVPEPAAAEGAFDWPPPSLRQAAEPEPASLRALLPDPEEAPQSELMPEPPSAAREQPEPEPEPEAMAAHAIAARLERAAEPAPAEPPPVDQSWEPEPGRRFRVRFLGSEARIPSGACAHCLRSDPRRTLAIVGAVVGPGGQPRRQSFTLPLCTRCARRVRARSEEERGARLMAHLISMLVAVVAMVGTLATGLVPLDSPLLAAGLLGALGLGGYGLPAWLLLARAGRFPRPEDALFVRSTLLVSAHPHAGETLFDWRSAGFASRFLEANAEHVGEHVFEVADPLAARATPTDEPAT